MGLLYGALTRDALITTGLIVYAGWVWWQRFSADLGVIGDDYEL